MKENFKVKEYLITKTTIAIAAAVFFFLPIAAWAAVTLYFYSESPAIYEGDTFLVNLKISAPDKPINVIDGTVLYGSDKLEIKEISTGGSLFTLWPKPPIFSNEKGTLNFVGGSPDGFQGEEGEVLKIVFLAKSKGEAKIDFLDGFLVFLHDGKGTQTNPWLRPLSLNILTRSLEIPIKDEWQSLIKNDKTPPEFFEIVLDQEPSIFDNQYFISFFATDKESGIDHYEVKEGDRDFIRAGSPYLLKDQELRSYVSVKAVDKAGNARIEKIAPQNLLKWYENYKNWIIIILVLTIFYAIYKGVKNKRQGV